MIRLFFLFIYLPGFISVFAQLKEDTLPVELIYFYAGQDNNLIYLNWGTATETNNYGYDIERADSNSMNFEVIGFMLGHGNSFSPKDYLFIDTTLKKTAIYSYRLKQIDTDGTIEYSDTVDVAFNYTTSVQKNFVSGGFRLLQNYPNPFNPETNIEYFLPEDGFANLVIYDTKGEQKTTMVAEYQNAGLHKAVLRINHLPSAIYFYKLTVEFNGVVLYSQSRKFLLLK